MFRIKKNKGFSKRSSAKKFNISGIENRIFMYIMLVIAVALVFVCIKYALTYDNTAEMSVPETYYKFSHKYDNEVADFSDPLAEPETEPQADPSEGDATRISASKEITPISCWGDSFTVAFSDNSISYAGIIANIADRTVYNVGIPGDSLKTIAGRQGGIPLVTTPFIIPQDKTPVEITLDSSIGGRIDPDFSKNAGLNPCTIKGVDGMISKINGKLYFTRNESGTEVMVYEPEIVVTRGMSERRKDITVIFVGSDSSVSEPETFVQYYKNMVDYLETDMYIVLSPIIGDADKIKQTEDLLAAEFGEKFLNTRYALCAEAQAKHDDYIVSANDIALAKKGVIPQIYFRDGKYFNDFGSSALGTAVNKKLTDLGYYEAPRTSVRK